MILLLIPILNKHDARHWILVSRDKSLIMLNISLLYERDSNCGSALAPASGAGSGHEVSLGRDQEPALLE